MNRDTSPPDLPVKSSGPAGEKEAARRKLIERDVGSLAGPKMRDG